MPKTNKYAGVIYDEDMLPKLVEWFTSNHYCVLISPLHDLDTWTQCDIDRYVAHNEKQYGVKIDPDAESWRRPTGEVKYINGRKVREYVEVQMPKVGQSKVPHRHFIVKYDYSVLATTVIKEFCDANFRILYFEPVRSERGYIRYLAHLDNPEKHRYDRDGVISLGGYDLQPLYDELRQDKLECFRECLKAMRDHPKLDLRGMCQFFLDHNRLDLASELRTHASFWKVMLWQDYRKAGS